MDRFVYCPVNLDPQNALQLAAEWQLPIQHGDSERSMEHDFDRSVVSIVSIPTHLGFNRQSIQANIQEPVPVQYIDEWNDISSYLFELRPFEFVVGGQRWDVPAMQLDKHRVSMNIAVTFPGGYELVAVKDGADTLGISVVINDGERDE